LIVLVLAPGRLLLACHGHDFLAAVFRERLGRLAGSAGVAAPGAGLAADFGARGLRTRLGFAAPGSGQLAGGDAVLGATTVAALTGAAFTGSEVVGPAFTGAAFADSEAGGASFTGSASAGVMPAALWISPTTLSALGSVGASAPDGFTAPLGVVV